METIAITFSKALTPKRFIYVIESRIKLEGYKCDVKYTGDIEPDEYDYELSADDPKVFFMCGMIV